MPPRGLSGSSRRSPRIAQARVTFDRLLAKHPHDATFHVGLANACALEFDARRADARPDVDSLQFAVTHAREACRLSPSYGEAWATLGFVPVHHPAPRARIKIDALNLRKT
jgi:hypothetical protein